jgi:hypothetical protein
VERARTPYLAKDRPCISEALRRAHGLSVVHNWSLHDLRRTMALWLARLGIQLTMLAAVLNYRPG